MKLSQRSKSNSHGINLKFQCRRWIYWTPRVLEHLGSVITVRFFGTNVLDKSETRSNRFPRLQKIRQNEVSITHDSFLSDVRSSFTYFRQNPRDLLSSSPYSKTQNNSTCSILHLLWSTSGSTLVALRYETQWNCIGTIFGDLLSVGGCYVPRVGLVMIKFITIIMNTKWQDRLHSRRAI